MNEENNFFLKLIGILIVFIAIYLGVTSVSKDSPKPNTVQTGASCCISYEDELLQLEDENTNLKIIIDELNSQIENAQFDAWGSYEEMGEALESLNTVHY